MRLNFAEHRIQVSQTLLLRTRLRFLRQTMSMNGERTADTSPVQHPDEVQWRFAVVPLLLSAVLVLSVLAYRCRAHRLRRERLAREQHEERREFAGESYMEVLVWVWGAGCVILHAQCAI